MTQTFKKSNLESAKKTSRQSICTHYSSLSGQPDIFLGSGTLKNEVQNMDLKKAGSKKQGHCYSKREEAVGYLTDQKVRVF